MNFVQAIILGIIQGLTEFLPVSSSGHLVLLQHVLGLEEAEILFDVSVHLGTLVAVIVVFRREIKNIVMALPRLIAVAGKKDRAVSAIESDPELKMAVLIVIGFIPTALLGLAFSGIADRLFSSVLIVGFMLMVTGWLLWLTRWTIKTARQPVFDRLNFKNAFLIGIVQGLAIIPGISRSGSTISIGMLLGIERETAARYSFLLSIPAIVGAGLLSLIECLHETDLSIKIPLVGAVTAAIVGYAALRALLKVVKKGGLHMFAPYCWLVGLLAIAFGW
ncbi:MAG: undecaprenyl-diphosphatase UppP [Deltaproteobacteria bacterium]|nr:undecaprenyl-diphosphatase UppP [Deltaproteobacteria bacterium]